MATFGGPTWTYVPEIGQWYFHQFSPWQPDLNWENTAMRREAFREDTLTRIFSPDKHNFSQEYWMYFKKNWGSMVEREAAT